jgi:hypothetical protein
MMAQVYAVIPFDSPNCGLDGQVIEREEFREIERAIHR